MEKMLPKTFFLAFLLFQTTCEGFDFTFHSPPNGNANATSGQECGVMTCSETVADDPHGARKIAGLTVYRHSSDGGSENGHWIQVASVTSQSPGENKVSDAKRIVGELSDTKAYLIVRLLKSSDCSSPKFSCAAKLVDGNGQTTMMKSVIGDEIDTDRFRSPERESNADLTDRNAFQVLNEKLECIETRLGDSLNRDDRLEDKLEHLMDKISNLERAVSHNIESSGNRIEDKMDRLKDRLEDKLSEVSAGKPAHRIESECSVRVCNNVSSQLAFVEESVESINKNLSSLSDEVHDIKISMLTATAVNYQLDKLATGLAGISTQTDGLTASVDALGTCCADKVPVQVEEFFDVLDTGKKEWRLAFRGTAHNNVEVYPAYLYGTGIPAEVEAGCKQFNHSLPCANHYRNRDALENWANVKEVLLALYAKGQMVKQITFNGIGSTSINWFEGKRVLASSWSDLKTLPHNLFSIEGDIRPELLRRFYVGNVYGGCAGDKGWFAAGDALPGACPWERKLARPAFIYAKGNTVALWASQNVARADAMGIFIKYQ